MTLGTAARRSMKNSRASETLAGASSARKMAAPMPSGTAIRSETPAVTVVPNMNGSAPNWSKIGSQTEVRKKLKPNLCRARTEPCHNSKTRSKVTRTTEAANKKVIMRAISSPSRRRERNEREPATGLALGTVVVVVATLSQPVLLDLVDGLQFLGHHFVRELR